MTFDQKIQIWNTIGTWIAGIGTLIAVVVALCLSRKAEKVNLKVNAGIVTSMGDGHPQKYVMVKTTNLADRDITINSIGWTIGKGKEKKFSLQAINHPKYDYKILPYNLDPDFPGPPELLTSIKTPQSSFCDQYPIKLHHGNSANFFIPLDSSSEWVQSALKFVSDSGNNNLKTFKTQIHTSVGKTIEKSVAKELLTLLRECQYTFLENNGLHSKL